MSRAETVFEGRSAKATGLPAKSGRDPGYPFSSEGGLPETRFGDLSLLALGLPEGCCDRPVWPLNRCRVLFIRITDGFVPTGPFHCGKVFWLSPHYWLDSMGLKND